MQQAKQSLINSVHSAPASQQDVLARKSHQLRALLATMYGGGGEAFRGCSDEIQDGVLWLAFDLASEMEQLVAET